MNLREYKWKLIAVAVVYIIICVPIIGGLMTSMELSVGEGSKLVLGVNNWSNYMLNPVTIFQTMFDGGDLQRTYFVLCGLVLVVLMYMSVKFILKSRKTYDYQGQEMGSSDWSKHGEEFKKNPDGTEILNKHEGFILSKDNYLGLDGKKVKINKNILTINSKNVNIILVL